MQATGHRGVYSGSPRGFPCFAVALETVVPRGGLGKAVLGVVVLLVSG